MRRYAFKVARGHCVDEGAHHKHKRDEEDDILRPTVVSRGSIGVRHGGEKWRREREWKLATAGRRLGLRSMISNHSQR